MVLAAAAPKPVKSQIVSPSDSPDADVDYLFVQVMVNERRVDTTPNCGNMLCAVGPFAIEKGLVKAQSPGDDSADPQPEYRYAG